MRERPGLLALALWAMSAVIASSGAHAEEPADEARTKEWSARIEAALEGAADPIEALEALLPAARAAHPTHALQVRARLADLHARLGSPGTALTLWEDLLDELDVAHHRLGYAEALLGVAMENLAGGMAGSTSVLPYLEDASAAIAPVADGPDDARARLTPEDAARFVWLRAQLTWWRGDAAATVDLLASLREADWPIDWWRAFLERRAEARYRLGRYAEAADDYRALERPLGEAASLAAAGDGAAAAEIYGALLAERPADEALLAGALAAVRYAGGRETLLSALADIEAEGRAGARLLLARAGLLDRGNAAPEIEALIRQAIETDPDWAEPYVDLGRHLLLTDPRLTDATREAAAEAFLAALARAPEDERAQAGAAHVAGRDYQDLWRLGGRGRRAERSLEIQQALVAAVPDDATAWANLGNTLRLLGRTEEALAAYDRALEENPYDPAIWSDRGLALSAAGRDRDAEQAYLDSLARDDAHLAGRQNLARSLWRRGEDERAAAELAAGLSTARALGRAPGTWRFLLDRTWRTRLREGLR